MKTQIWKSTAGKYMAMAMTKEIAKQAWQDDLQYEIENGLTTLEELGGITPNNFFVTDLFNPVNTEDAAAATGPSSPDAATLTNAATIGILWQYD